MTSATDIAAFWDAQAAKGATAGTQDLILKQLEQRVILAAVERYRPSTVLEVGCGRGELARLIVSACPWLDYLAVDASREMIAAARSQPTLRSRLRFAHRDIAHLPTGYFDMVITERMLINLQGWEARKAGIDIIASRLNPGGHYVMCEHSQEGLDAINATRQTLGLPAIPVPWHNGRYLSDAELATVTSLRLVRCEPFSATYYLLSRIVNAKLAHDAGHEPSYDAPVNQFALDLPAVGPWAQGRLWVWRKP